MNVSVCTIREIIEKQDIEKASWCNSNSQLADYLKKTGALDENFVF